MPRRSNIIVRFMQSFFGSIFASFHGIGSLIAPKRFKKRRNADFEKAGREVRSRQKVDPKSTAQLNRATMERDLEVLNAIRLENKMMRRRDAEAQEYRKAKEQDNVKVSRGDVINHLAEMQRKAAEKQKAEKEKRMKDTQDSTDTDQNGQLSDPGTNPTEENAS